MAMYSILLLKARSSGEVGDTDKTMEEYEKKLTKLGCKVFFICPLQFDFLNIDKLKDKFLEHETFSGLVLTSPRSVDACKKAFSSIDNEIILKIWREEKTCYTVGPSTAQKATQDLIWSPSLIRGGHQCGSSESLASYICEEYKKEHTTARQKILLYPCGNLKRETLTKGFEKDDLVRFETVTCYKTSSNEGLEDDIKLLSNEINSLDMVVFFSPSGVKSSWSILHKYFVKPPKCIAIGPTTMESLKGHSKERNILFESQEPSPHGIQIIVNQIIKQL